MALPNATEQRAVSSPVHDSFRARNACAWIMRAHAHASDRENARADTPWLMERRARRKARGRAPPDEINSPRLLARSRAHARVCACASFRLIILDYHLIALLVICWLLTLRRMEQRLFKYFVRVNNCVDRDE